MILDKIDKIVNEYKEEIIDNLRQLIKIPTENPPGLNYNEFVTYASKWLSSLGYSTEVIKVPNAELPKLAKLGYGDRPNLIATTGKGKLSIAFNGHYDVVPAGEGWSVNPYDAVVINDRIYGRGASDMKSGIVAQIYSVEVLKKIVNVDQAFKIRHFLVPDEETVGNENAGTYFVIREGYLSKSNTDYVIFTEPSGVENICNGHRGSLWGFIKILGKKAHGGSPQLGIDAIRKSTEVLTQLYSLQDKLSNKRTKYNIIPSNVKSPSLIVGQIKCGDWVNMVADECTFGFVRRLIPEEKLENARKEIINILESKKARDPEFKYEYDEYYAVDTIVEDTKNPLYESLSEAITSVLNVKPKIGLLAATFDMRFTHYEGIPAVNYGPGKIELAHATDEYVNIADLLNSIKVLSLTLYLLGKKYGMLN
ncbi:ArgE/DapE family deacylase [Acidianus infernus]|uniref:Probable succinyl-diaminopimelate desuccinylase n=1 Tax=Acidianus infernus TaxID=12915 RepID=A0A6A9QFF3_ACIIN|nr:M20 family metallopeptidase [Acidianus infernus]MUM64894.1 ArgE/DapE family deacylase [Acidianus infernus]